MAPAFLPEPTLQYIARTVEIAQLHCEQWAKLKQVSGEHAVKDFTFHVATELVIGFPTSFLTKELLARQKCLFLAWLAGFVALPVNLPGFGKQIKTSYQEPPVFVQIKLWQTSRCTSLTADREISGFQTRQ
ncbi:TPA: hypothetical protein ACH3X1_001074 [Trebouxia sp. C0004]